MCLFLIYLLYYTHTIYSLCIFFRFYLLDQIIVICSSLWSSPNVSSCFLSSYIVYYSWCYLPGNFLIIYFLCIFACSFVFRYVSFVYIDFIVCSFMLISFLVIVVYMNKGAILYCIWIDPLLCFVCLLLRLYYKINIEFIFFFYFLELIIKEIVFNDCVFDFMYCWILDQYYCLASWPFIIWWIRYSIAYKWYFVMPVP